MTIIFNKENITSYLFSRSTSINTIRRIFLISNQTHSSNNTTRTNHSILKYHNMLSYPYMIPNIYAFTMINSFSCINIIYNMWISSSNTSIITNQTITSKENISFFRYNNFNSLINPHILTKI